MSNSDSFYGKITIEEFSRRTDFFGERICLLDQIVMEDGNDEIKWLEECPSEVWEEIFQCFRWADTRTLLACRATCKDFRLGCLKFQIFLKLISATRFSCAFYPKDYGKAKKSSKN